MGALDRLVPRLRQGRLLGLGLNYFLSRLKDEDTTTAARLVAATAAAHPGRVAIHFEGRRITYAELDAAANRVANLFASAGAEKGDVVALLMDNRPEYLVMVLGLNKLGVVASLVNTHVVGPALAHAIRVCSPRFLVVGAEHAQAVRALGGEQTLPEQAVFVHREDDAAVVGGRDLARELAGASAAATPSVDVRAKDPMLYMYTSGTTGLPKAAVIKNQRYLRAAYTFGKILCDLREDDVTYVTMPLYHATATMAAFGSVVVTGSTLALRRKFSASAFFDDCEAYGVTCFPYIGELCRYLLQSPPHPKERAHRIRVMMGAGLRKDVWLPFVERFGNPRIVEFYAATEGNVAIVNLDQRPGMLGMLLPGQEVVRVDPATEIIERDAQGRTVRCKPGEKGMILGRIDRVNRFDGYLDAKKTDEKVIRNAFGDGNDYFNTGDLVEVHDDGYVSFADRLGDTFRWKGENVSTTEVSIALNECPGVLESNVYGVEVPGSDGRAGMVALVVEPSFDLATFAAHVNGRLPRYARPVFVRMSRELALTGSFKYVKTDLKKSGFDPRGADAATYYLDASGAYVPLDEATYARIVRGEQRL